MRSEPSAVRRDLEVSPCRNDPVPWLDRKPTSGPASAYCSRPTSPSRPQRLTAEDPSTGSPTSTRTPRGSAGISKSRCRGPRRSACAAAASCSSRRPCTGGNQPASLDAPSQPTLVYLARGLVLLRQASRHVDGALGAVVGPIRATVLAAPDAPRSTTEIASAIDLSAGCVSAHLTALQNAGLVSSSRDGHPVLYARTLSRPARRRRTAPKPARATSARSRRRPSCVSRVHPRTDNSVLGRRDVVAPLARAV